MTRRRRKRSPASWFGLTSLIVVALAAMAVAWTSVGPGRVDYELAKVESITDGDTFRAEGLGPVRIIGIDTPETYDNRHGPKGCWGDAATAELERMMPPGTVVSLSHEKGDRDDYKRLLRHVLVPVKGDVGEHMLREGFAHVLMVAPNTNRASRYADLESRAEAKGLRVHGACP